MGVFGDWAAAASANAMTSAFLHPLDVLKTHLQLTNISMVGKSEAGAGSFRQVSMTHTFSTIYRERGLVGLWLPGLRATMLREMSSSGVRAGFYIEMREQMDHLVGRETDAPTLKRVLAAMSTGWLSAVLSNPIDGNLNLYPNPNPSPNPNPNP